MKNIMILLLGFVIIPLACKKDNYPAPTMVDVSISGKIISDDLNANSAFITLEYGFTQLFFTNNLNLQIDGDTVRGTYNLSGKILKSDSEKSLTLLYQIGAFPSGSLRHIYVPWKYSSDQVKADLYDIKGTVSVHSTHGSLNK